MEQPAWNQDLLDWLAEDLVAHDYDVKHTIDPHPHLPRVPIARGQPGRIGRTLSSAVPACGGCRPSSSATRLARSLASGIAKADFGNGTNQIRASLVAADPLTVALGRPNREQVVTTRATVATTLQALELTNGETLAKILHRGAEQLAAAGPSRAT